MTDVDRKKGTERFTASQATLSTQARRVRVCFAGGTWQVLMLVAALKTARERDQEQGSADYLFLYEREQAAGLRSWLEKLASALWTWARVEWAENVVPLSPPEGAWPLPLAEYHERLRQHFDGGEVVELWFNQYAAFPHRLLLELWPRARWILYEEGLMTYTPHLVAKWRLKDALVLLPKHLLLGLRGRLGAHRVSQRVCDWRWHGRYLRRLERACLFLGDVLPLSDPFRGAPITLVEVDSLRGVLAEALSFVELEKRVRLAEVASDRDVLIVGAAAYRIGYVSRQKEEAVYEHAVRDLIAKGYRVIWKEHPRHKASFFPALAERCGSGLVEAAMDPALPVELALHRQRCRCCVSVISSSLFYVPRLYDIQAFTLAGLMSDVQPSGGDRHVLQMVSERIPSAELIPPAA